MKSPKFRVVVPLPVVCAKLAARIPLAVTLAALEIVKAPRGLVFPTNPVNTILPAVPAVRSSENPPSKVEPKVTVAPAGDPPALVVSTNTLPVSVVAEL